MLDIEDPKQLNAYLLSKHLVEAGEKTDLRPLQGGVSCVTVSVGRRHQEDFVIKQALPRLRVASRWVSSPKRAHREAQGIRYLQKLAPGDSIPALLFEDSENHVLAMQAVAQPHDNWKKLLLAGTLIEDHARQFGALLGTIHAKAFDQSREIEPVFRDYSFFETLRLEPYYEYTASRVPAAADFIQSLLKQTRSQRITLTHGDYSPKNVLVRNGRLILLDHETIHWGDPMFDIGFSLTHFLSKANHDPKRRREFVRLARSYWQTYRDKVGTAFWNDRCEPRAVRHTLACLLARVHGRSPLEYLDKSEQANQRECVLALMQDTPASVVDLIDSFTGRIKDPQPGV